MKSRFKYIMCFVCIFLLFNNLIAYAEDSKELNLQKIMSEDSYVILGELNGIDMYFIGAGSKDIIGFYMGTDTNKFNCAFYNNFRYCVLGGSTNTYDETVSFSSWFLKSAKIYDWKCAIQFLSEDEYSNWIKTGKLSSNTDNYILSDDLSIYPDGSVVKSDKYIDKKMVYPQNVHLKYSNKFFYIDWDKSKYDVEVRVKIEGWTRKNMITLKQNFSDLESNEFGILPNFKHLIGAELNNFQISQDSILMDLADKYKCEYGHINKIAFYIRFIDGYAEEWRASKWVVVTCNLETEKVSYSIATPVSGKPSESGDVTISTDENYTNTDDNIDKSDIPNKPIIDNTGDSLIDGGEPITNLNDLIKAFGRIVTTFMNSLKSILESSKGFINLLGEFFSFIPKNILILTEFGIVLSIFLMLIGRR